MSFVSMVSSRSTRKTVSPASVLQPTVNTSDQCPLVIYKVVDRVIGDCQCVPL